MVLIVKRSDHEMICLPDGGEIPGREKQMIQTSKLLRTFLWNPYALQVIDATPCQKERCSRPLTISEILLLRSLLGAEREVKQC
jgi:hypothetical protein